MLGYVNSGYIRLGHVRAGLGWLRQVVMLGQFKSG
jgi:hypothetical protein